MSDIVVRFDVTRAYHYYYNYFIIIFFTLYMNTMYCLTQSIYNYTNNTLRRIELPPPFGRTPIQVPPRAATE
jgi:hypothetical protein